MPRKLTGVVMRQLWDNQPTPSTVITIPERYQGGAMDEEAQKYYIREEALNHKKLVGEKMVEFRSAKWKIVYMEVPDHHNFELPSNYHEEDL